MSYSISHRLFNCSLRLLSSKWRKNFPDSYFKAVAESYQILDRILKVTVRGHEFQIVIESETSRVRAERMPDHEPDTLDWIETFAPNDVFWDIGSNIGLFSLYAAKARGVQVVAIDPLPHNHSGIVRNLALNKLTAKVTPLCVAISAKVEIGQLYVPTESDTPGGGNVPFGQNTDNYGREVQQRYALQTIGMSVDDLLTILPVPFPNHIKLDIDGIQQKVIEGALKTLADTRVKSLMLELQPQNYRAIIELMQNIGFNYTKCAATRRGDKPEPDRGDTNHFFVRSHRAGQ